MLSSELVVTVLIQTYILYLDILLFLLLGPEINFNPNKVFFSSKLNGIFFDK